MATAFFASLLLITIAEMGDKTQLLAMAFATRYKARTVLSAVFFATIANHALAVLVGRALATYISFEFISFLASASFVLFGLWTLRGDSLDGEDKKASSFGPFVTVLIAFFLAEMGDKTQLATVSMAIQYDSAIGVLMGTTCGMIVADGIGIGAGVVLGKHLPERLIKLISATIFIVIGVVGMLAYFF